MQKHIQAITSQEGLFVRPDLANWSDIGRLEGALKHVKNTFETDYSTLMRRNLFLFDVDLSVHESTQNNASMIAYWHETTAPTLTALACFALDQWKITLAPDVYQAVIVASLLGEVENSVPYHNNMHFRKVLVQLIRLITVHQDLFAGTKHVLTDEEIGLLLLSACVHDLGHDGTGNTVKGVFQQSRLERRSLEIVSHYMAALGFEPQSPQMQAVSLMILSTDVTPINDPSNPMNQMKAAYRFHYRGDKARLESLHLDKDLLPLQKNERLALMGLLMHEADIATSAGITYQTTKFETILYRQEACEDHACPQHILDFLAHICQRQFLSDAGQHLFGANMAKIFAQCETDVQNGNETFARIIENEMRFTHAVYSAHRTTH